jgi:hypothetical protein
MKLLVGAHPVPQSSKSCSSIVLFHTRYVLRNIHAHAHDINRNHVKIPLVLDTKSRLRRELYRASMSLTPAVLKRFSCSQMPMWFHSHSLASRLHRCDANVGVLAAYTCSAPQPASASLRDVNVHFEGCLAVRLGLKQHTSCWRVAQWKERIRAQHS